MALTDKLKKANETMRPLRIIAYGTQGIGKNTFAGTFHKPVVMPFEPDGAAAMDIMTFPKVDTFGEIIENINDLLTGEHDYRTLILDTIDWMEPLVWKHVMALNNWSSIEEPGYGKGYLEADNYWRHIMGGLDALRDRGMMIIALAHSEIKHFEPPDAAAYDLYQMKLNKRSSALWQEWVDMVLFMKHRVTIRQEKKQFGGKNDGRNIGTGAGERIICTEARPAYYAKNRHGLPDEIIIGKDATYQAFHDALTAATGGKYTRG